MQLSNSRVPLKLLIIDLHNMYSCYGNNYSTFSYVHTIQTMHCLKVHSQNLHYISIKHTETGNTTAKQPTAMLAKLSIQQATPGLLSSLPCLRTVQTSNRSPIASSFMKPKPIKFRNMRSLIPRRGSSSSSLSVSFQQLLALSVTSDTSCSQIATQVLKEPLRPRVFYSHGSRSQDCRFADFFCQYCSNLCLAYSL